MILGDTDQVPNDGGTSGSGTTPRTVLQLPYASQPSNGREPTFRTVIPPAATSMARE